MFETRRLHAGAVPPVAGSQRRIQSGLTLVELLVALALSAILMTGVAQVFVGMRQTERTQDAMSRMQDAGRFAMNFLAQDIRMAGYVGCLSGLDPADINNTLNGPPPSFEPDKGIQGWDANGTDPGQISNSVNNVAVADTGTGGWVTSAGNSLEDANVVPNTDIIRVWGAGNMGPSNLDGEINSITPGANTVVNTKGVDVQIGDILLLSDCQQADWVQACNVQQTGTPPTLNLTLSTGCVPGNVANLNLGVDEGGNVVKLGGTQYYIGKRGDVATNPPALFRRRLNTTASLGAGEELVEGIANMQILYGENTDNDNRNTADSYVPADQVSDWTNVVSVRITLLIQSVEDNLVPTPQPYTYNGVTYDGGAGNGALPDDRRLRRGFTTTIGVRNRIL